jgi:hypothetical protein
MVALGRKSRNLQGLDRHRIVVPGFFNPSDLAVEAGAAADCVEIWRT